MSGVPFHGEVETGPGTAFELSRRRVIAAETSHQQSVVESVGEPAERPRALHRIQRFGMKMIKVNCRVDQSAASGSGIDNATTERKELFVDSVCPPLCRIKGLDKMLN